MSAKSRCHDHVPQAVSDTLSDLLSVSGSIPGRSGPRRVQLKVPGALQQVKPPAAGWNRVYVTCVSPRERGAFCASCGRSGKRFPSFSLCGGSLGSDGPLTEP